VACVLIVGALPHHAGGAGSPDTTLLLHAVYLGVLGGIIACMGGAESKLRRGLHLLHEVNNVWNPRFGVERTMALNLDRMVRFFDADSALLLLKSEDHPPRYTVYVATPRTAGNTRAANELGAEAAHPFVELEQQGSLHYSQQHMLGRLLGRLPGLRSGRRAAAQTCEDACQRVANVLDARSFVSVPYVETTGRSGRLLVTSTRFDFARGDVHSLRQIADAVSMVLENSRLMEQLIADATEHERYKISRDLHDSTIQPYIGLKIGLQALYREAVGADSALSPRIQDLIEMTGEAVEDLRTYAANLREGSGIPGNGLLAAVNDHVERYRRFFGLKFEMDCRLTREISGQLAAELFHFLVEGMSNVFKHTRAKSGTLHIACNATHVMVRVVNEIPRGFHPEDFRPRSIAERVASLGGELTVQPANAGYTIVSATIPS
jgi:signal transduction histidine kinase